MSQFAVQSSAEGDVDTAQSSPGTSQVEVLPPSTTTGAPKYGSDDDVVNRRGYRYEGEQGEEDEDEDEKSGSSTDVGSEVATDSECDEEQTLHPNFYDWREVYGDMPSLSCLRENYKVILEELERLEDPALFSWPEENLYDGVGEEWKVLPFLHTFPGNDPSKSVWMDRFCEMCPETVKLLRKIPGIRTALFSRMGPQTRLSAHRGWADLANHVLRLHLGLRIPFTKSAPHKLVNEGANGNSEPKLTAAPEDHTCGLWVRGEKRYHRPGEIICFDDSKLHKAFNNHPTEKRSVLIFDIARPSHLPFGSAQKGHTDALDGFISYFR